MTLIRGSIRYPVTVIVAVLIAIIAGLVSLSRIPIQLTPEIERPRVSVTTVWPGASPEEVEKDVVKKQEEFLMRCSRNLMTAMGRS